MKPDGSSPREFSHPILWLVGVVASAGAMAWVFAHWFGIGAHHGRDIGRVDFAPHSVAAPVDHPALIADRSPAVLDRGQQLYLRNCAACHGANGDQNMTGSNPAPRNLRTDAYLAEWGGGPYGFYLTLTKGWGRGMPGFSALSPADRYAIVHFVRERWQQGTPIYAAGDPPAVQAQIPQPGASAGEGPRVAPHLVEQHPRLHPLMAVAARDGSAAEAATLAWVGTAVDAAEPAERALLARVQAAGRTRVGWLERLRTTAAAGDRAGVVALLVSPDSGDPSLALAPAAAIDAAAQVLITAAGRKA
jgi:mono/diheme cytochrome c family protein